MCYRYAIPEVLHLVASDMQAAFVPPVHPGMPQYNAAPHLQLPVLTDSHRITWMEWGLIPHWAQSADIATHTMNARSETLWDKPAYRHLVGRRHCLAIAGGFFEWEKRGKERLPYYITLRHRPYMLLAGLWDEWVNSAGEVVQSFTVLTTEPNSLVATLHDRMPVVLPPGQERQWLDTPMPRAEVERWLQPLPAEAMQMHRVSPRVNRVGVNSPDLLQPWVEAPGLFG